MWLVSDEAHVTTIAMREEARGKGLGELLLASLISLSFRLGTRWVTLEVRVSNDVAQSLYRKYGFRNAGVRKRYYSDNNEDALIMTTDDITLNAYRAQFDALTAKLASKFAQAGGVEAHADALRIPLSGNPAPSK
jgi:ribosomal-protein-alanine N-acetyltransferase